MSYRSGEDPQLLDDLRAALRRWHRTALGQVALAARLSEVGRRRAANPRLGPAEALRETLLAALAVMRDGGLAAQADLLHQHYVERVGVYQLQEEHALSERSIYNRLREAAVSLAHAVWAMEQPAPEPELAPPPGAPGKPAPSWWRARHLPAPTYTSLFGVQEALDALLDRINDPRGHWMICVEGMGGLGKTALVREAAGRVAETDRFADIAWLTVEPLCYTPDGLPPAVPPPPTCDQVMDGIGAQLAGQDLAPLPAAEKRGRVTALLRASRYLVVVDNLEMVTDAGTVLERLRELANPTTFVFTSRRRVELDGYPWTVVALGELVEGDSLALIRHEGDLRGLCEVAGATDDQLRPIYRVVGGNPLAIKLVVGQLVALPLDRVLAGLAAAQPRTDAFYDYLFRASWELLSPPACTLLRHLAFLPAEGATWQDLAVSSGLSDEGLAAAVAELIGYSLLQSAGLKEKVYTLHPLTRHFVTRQIAAIEESGQERAAGSASW